MNFLNNFEQISKRVETYGGKGLYRLVREEKMSNFFLCGIARNTENMEFEVTKHKTTPNLAKANLALAHFWAWASLIQSKFGSGQFSRVLGQFLGKKTMTIWTKNRTFRG